MTERDPEIEWVAIRWGIPLEDLKAWVEIEPGTPINALAGEIRYYFDKIAERAGELAYLLNYEGDIFANAERYRTIRGDIVARAS